MKNPTMRIAAALLLVLSLAMLCACAPRYIGEERAKQAGLKLLRQAFGVTAQEAHVEYYERAGSSAVDNSEVGANGTAPTQIYIVTDLAPRNRASYNVRKKRKKTNKGAERRWQERTTQLNRSLSSCGR